MTYVKKLDSLSAVKTDAIENLPSIVKENLMNSHDQFRQVTRDLMWLNPYPNAFPYGNGMVLHFYQQQESSTTKTVHKVINKGLKTYV